MSEQETPNGESEAAGNVVPIAAAREQAANAKQEGVTEATEAAEKSTAARIKSINNLCAIAGRPDLVGGFLEEGLTEAQVQEKLIEGRADASGSEIDGSAPGAPGRQAKALDPMKAIANWNNQFGTGGSK